MAGEFPQSPHSLTIAGVELHVRTPLDLSDLPDPAYAAFQGLSNQEAAVPSTIDVEVLDGLAPPNDSAPLFESDEAWNMQPEGDGYRLSFHGREAGSTHTVACSDGATTRVRVYIDQDVRSAAAASERRMNPVRYPLDQVLLMNHLAERGGLIVHSASAILEERAYVFPGVSGAGKSTLCRMFMAAGKGESLLSDDRAVVRVSPDGRGGLEHVEAWGTPWSSSAEVARDSHAPLAALLFLVQADTNEVVPLAAGPAMHRLLRVVSCPWYDAGRVPGVLDSCALLVENVPCYDLRFSLDGELIPLLTAARVESGSRKAQ